MRIGWWLSTPCSTVSTVPLVTNYPILQGFTSCPVRPTVAIRALSPPYGRQPCAPGAHLLLRDELRSHPQGVAAQASRSVTSKACSTIRCHILLYHPPPRATHTAASTRHRLLRLPGTFSSASATSTGCASSATTPGAAARWTPLAGPPPTSEIRPDTGQSYAARRLRPFKCSNFSIRSPVPTDPGPYRRPYLRVLRQVR